MTHPKRTTRPTEKIRQAQLDFATRGNRPKKRVRVNALATPVRQTLPMPSTPVQMRLSSPRASLFASQ